jgi:ribosomal protein S18 acetylase RimI-like enzyme
VTAARRIEDLIRPATRSDLEAMAAIHVGSGTPGLLTELGARFLARTYYRKLLEHPKGRAFAIDIGGSLAGFVTFSDDSEDLYSTIFRGSLPQTVAALTTSALRHPRVVRDFLETVVKVRPPSSDAEPRAEIVSLEVARPFQGLGLGFFLLEHAVEALVNFGVTGVKARILADHAAVVRLYRRLGFSEAQTFSLHGRAWILMVR